MKEPRHVEIEFTDSIAHTDSELKVTFALSELAMWLKAERQGQAAGPGEFGDRYSASLLYLTTLHRIARDASLPTYFEVSGDDGFYAQIPWTFADSAMFRFPAAPSQMRPISENGFESSPGNSSENSSDDGEGLRLYVNNSSNACLNVKSIVRIRFANDKVLTEPVFGAVSP